MAPARPGNRASKFAENGVQDNSMLHNTQESNRNRNNSHSESNNTYARQSSQQPADGMRPQVISYTMLPHFAFILALPYIFVIINSTI